MTESSLTLFMISSFPDISWTFQSHLNIPESCRFLRKRFLSFVVEAIPAVWAGIFHFGSVLLEINASFYERVACLTESVFPSVNLLSFFVSMMVKSTSGALQALRRLSF